MSKRLLCLTLLALVAASSSGCNCICCLHDNLLGLYKSRRWADCGCGPVYYGPWFDSPPECCDPCDSWGNFTGKRYWISGNSYPGNSYQRNSWQGNNAGMPMGGPAGGGPVMDDSMDGMDVQGEMIGPGNQTPTPAAPQMNQPQPAAPPASGSPRMGRRPRGMAIAAAESLRQQFQPIPRRQATSWFQNLLGEGDPGAAGLRGTCEIRSQSLRVLKPHVIRARLAGSPAGAGIDISAPPRSAHYRSAHYRSAGHRQLRDSSAAGS